MPEMNKKRLLFVAEAATLAHVARPLALSASVDRTRFELEFACAPRSHWLLQHFPGPVHGLDSVDAAHFIAALAQGKPLYDETMLDGYVRDDLALLDAVRPDAVVGDFRLSLSVSARLAGVPYLTISNGYWSPHWRPRRYPVPSLPLTRVLPIPIAGPLFRMVRPSAFALHCRPLNRVRRSHGLPGLGSDLRRVYTDADRVMYADVPELFPGARMPSHHQFIGPALWSPPFPVPAWWDRLDGARPVVYVTLGSSGQARLLVQALEALSTLDVVLIASTAGAAIPGGLPANVLVAPYLPGDAAAARASLVVCNGGSPTSQQALAAGVPVIGIADNLDQYLNMGTIEAAGAGATLRADRFDGAALRAMAQEMLRGDGHRAAAGKVARWFADAQCGPRFGAILDDLLH